MFKMIATTQERTSQLAPDDDDDEGVGYGRVRRAIEAGNRRERKKLRGEASRYPAFC